MKKNKFVLTLLIFLFFSLKMINGYQSTNDNKPNNKHNLKFTSIPAKWDEGMPLGNGMLGALIWQKGNSLRIALDRADLCDLRIQKEFDSPNPEKGGILRIINPFNSSGIKISGNYKSKSISDPLIVIETVKGNAISINSK